MIAQSKYLFDRLTQEEESLRTERPTVPVALSSENDRNRSGPSLVILGGGALSIELGLGYIFFREVIQLPPLVALTLALGVVILLSGGGKHVLESIYVDVEDAARRLRNTTSARTNVLLRTNLSGALEAARRRYRAWHKRFAFIGWALCVTGALALGVERVWMQLTEAESFSALAYVYNTALLAGASLLSASAYLSYSKRNQEVSRLTDLDARLEQIAIEKVNLLDDLNPEDTHEAPKPNGASTTPFLAATPAAPTNGSPDAAH